MVIAGFYNSRYVVIKRKIRLKKYSKVFDVVRGRDCSGSLKHERRLKQKLIRGY